MRDRNEAVSGWDDPRGTWPLNDSCEIVLLSPATATDPNESVSDDSRARFPHRYRSPTVVVLPAR